MRGAGGVRNWVELVEYVPVALLTRGGDERVVVMDSVGQFGDGQCADGGCLRELVQLVRKVDYAGRIEQRQRMLRHGC
jgi:hypothetical protein